MFSSPLDFDSVTASYQIADGIVRVRDLQYDSWAMKIAGSGEYALRTNQLNLQMTVNHGRGEVPKARSDLSPPLGAARHGGACAPG